MEHLEVGEILDLVKVRDKVNEIIAHLNKEEKYPMKRGERIMYAILGIGGGIYGFSTTPGQAEKVRDTCWNIGKAKPKKYIVSFKEV
jgi:hypothetical protein